MQDQFEAELEQYIGEESGKLPLRELEVWTLYYKQRREKKAIARQLDIDTWAVSESLLKLRHLVYPPLDERRDTPERIRIDLKRRLNTDFVYFIRDAEGRRVKIGHAKSPASRLRELQCGSAVILTIAALEPGGRNREKFLHETFEHVHMRGEWFHETQEVTRYIEEIKKRHTFCNTINTIDGLSARSGVGMVTSD